MQLFRAEVMEKPEPRKQVFVFNYAIMAEKIEDVRQALIDDGRLGPHRDDLVLIFVEPVEGATVSCGIETRTRSFLKDIQAKLENTIVLVTHDMGVQANVADRVAIMYAGKIVEEAPTDIIYGEPVHPYTQYLINSLPKFGDKSTRHSVPGSPPDLSKLPSGCPFHPRCPHVMDICKEEVPSYTRPDLNHRVACWLVGAG